LKSLFIVSDVQVHAAGSVAPDAADQYTGLAVAVQAADGEKCERCWILTPEVGQHAEHPSLCARCAEVVDTL
jgi:isoleucyl-tRNA synthetase